MIKPIKKLKIFGTKTFFAVLGIAIGVMSVIVVGFIGLCGVIRFRRAFLHHFSVELSTTGKKNKYGNFQM